MERRPSPPSQSTLLPIAAVAAAITLLAVTELSPNRVPTATAILALTTLTVAVASTAVGRGCATR